MVKTIHFKVTDELYYNLVSLKAQTHTDSWEGLMKHITQLKQPNSPQPEQPIITEQPQHIEQLKEPQLTTNPESTEQPDITLNPEQPEQLKQPEQPINPKRSLDTKNQKS